MARFAFQRMGTLLVAVSGSQAPLDEEWAGYMAVCTQLDVEVGLGSSAVTGLTVTDGGSPTGPQRLAMSTLLKGRSVDTAVVTDSTVLRAVISLFSYVNPGVQAFSPRDWEQAAAFARIDPAARPEVVQVVEHLGQKVGGRAGAAASPALSGARERSCASPPELNPPATHDRPVLTVTSREETGAWTCLLAVRRP